MSPKFTILEGNKASYSFVCPWCAKTFQTRDALDEHWETDPRCKANARSNNPTTAKYGSAHGIENIPGEATLTLIRQKGCEHPEPLREALYADLTGEGPVQGYRCGHCYTEVYLND